MMERNLNLTMLMDFYELTMAKGYFENGMKDTTTYFDMFFRRIPDGGGFAIMAGVEPLVEYLRNLSFDDEDIDFLRSKKMFGEDFLEYLKNFNNSKKLYHSCHIDKNKRLIITCSIHIH